MTCSRVIIINEGKLVAVDTPENLTARLKGSESIFMEIEGEPIEVQKAIEAVPSVTSVSVEPKQQPNMANYRVESKVGTDIRKELAALVIKHKWGLLELRPEGLSLEEIFLRLTTKEEELNWCQ